MFNQWLKHRYGAPACIILAATLWGLDSLVRYPTSLSFPLTTLVFLEHLIGVVLLAPFFWKSRATLPRIEPKHWTAFIIVAAFGAIVGNLANTRSIQILGPSTATLFLLLQPVGVLLLASLFLKERSSGRFFPVAVWVILNSLLIAFPDFNFGFSSGEIDYSPGIFFGLIASTAWAVSTVTQKWLLKTFSPVQSVFFRFLFATLFLGVVGEVKGELEFAQLSEHSDILPRLFFLSTVIGVFPYWLYNVGLKRLPASLVTLIEAWYPIMGIFVPMIVSGTPLAGLQIFGGVTLIVSLALLVQFESPEKEAR
ncbi:MAG: DMT family transporter [Proteobacteria bacterium]|nr:MAG: DMT family transporter [Pseudomonadota bacterium]